MVVAIADRSRQKCPHSREICLFICLSSSDQPPGTRFRYLMTKWAAADAICTTEKMGRIALMARVLIGICRPGGGPNYKSRRVYDAMGAYLKTRRE